MIVRAWHGDTMQPSMDYDKARFNMVEQQVRPWDVLDQSVLDLLFVVKREDFVPPEYRALAFTDMELPLKLDGVDTGEAMWSPKMEARILQELALRRHENALEIGTGSGHFSALLACKAQQVVSVEIDPRLAAFGAANLARGGVHNVRQEIGDASRGWPSRAPYDVIVATGSLPVMPAPLRNQLTIGGRLAAVVGDDPVMSAVIVTRVSDTGFDTLKLFETRIQPLRNAERPSNFRF